VASPEDLIGVIIDGRYRIDATLARGGMAMVYRATDLRLDRIVALKVMHAHLASDPEFVQRFEREARAAARLHHPHVVSVFDQGSDGDLVYLAMEYVEGRTLRDVMREYGPLTCEQSLILIEPVLKALQAAHTAGFVHRDIKPENILIADDGRVKVADFGLARAMATSQASATTGMIMGTVAYLAPEQVERGDADARTDLYATGVVLFEMVTNQVPHSGESPLAVAFQHVHADVPAPSTVNPAIPADVDALITSATRRNPQARFASAATFLDEVGRIRGDLPAARPLAEGATQQTVVVPAEAFIPPRRSRKGWIVAAVLTLLVAGAGFAGWFLAIGPGKTVATPDVIGASVADATDVMQRAELTFVVSGEDYSEEYPRDAVISTEPAAGSQIRVNGEVQAIISLGPERIDVPRLRGVTLDEATRTLTEANLVVGEQTTVFDTRIPEGQVVSTSPRAGAEVKAGGAVDVRISKGPAPVPVPDVVGVRAGAARTTLANADLEITVTERFSPSVAEGRVIATKPRAGRVIAAGDTVELVVSKGPPPVTVPNLVDMPRARAASTLRSLGLKVKVVSAGSVRLNRVIDQSPRPGAQIPRGSTVTITLI
jgi:beta-lactam-binding protein with PASTA domain/predicted Ser/Thr protein kinase